VLAAINTTQKQVSRRPEDSRLGLFLVYRSLSSTWLNYHKRN